MSRRIDAEELARAVQARAGRAPLALLFDYDGTLAEIAPRPEEARLSAPVRAALEALAAKRGVEVAIITGRSTEGLLAVSGPLRGVTIAANGGFRIGFPDGEWTHPEAARRVPLLSQHAATLATVVAAFPGTQLEEKGLSLALHFRRAPESETALREAVLRIIAATRGAFRLVEGKSALDLQPDVDWDKGRAVEVLLEHWGIADTALFLGDDVIDEPAFEAMGRRGGLACRVSADATPTAAPLCLPGVPSVHALLDRLVELL
jgi:trehalose-phosphatase